MVLDYFPKLQHTALEDRGVTASIIIFYNSDCFKRLQESERIRLCVEDKLSTLETEGKEKPEKITKVG